MLTDLPLSGLPNWSVTLTVTAGVNATPAVTEEGGPCTNWIALAGAVFTVSVCVALVNPLLAAVITGEPALVSV
jgi:hypothetical protein